MLPDPAIGVVAALNHLLRAAPWARQRLVPYAGRRAHLALPPFELALTVSESGEFTAAKETTDLPADVRVTLPSATPMTLLGGIDKLMAAAHVEGNAEFATELSFVFRHLHWDAEEDLSRLVGDIAARRIVKFAGQATDWQRQAIGNFKENLLEYGLHESGWLVPRSELDQFRTEVRQFEEAIGRMEKRLTN